MTDAQVEHIRLTLPHACSATEWLAARQPGDQRVRIDVTYLFDDGRSVLFEHERDAYGRGDLPLFVRGIALPANQWTYWGTFVVTLDVGEEDRAALMLAGVPLKVVA